MISLAERAPVLARTEPSAAPLDEDARARRIAVLFDLHYDAIWRTLRRPGVPEANVDDAAPRVFLVATLTDADRNLIAAIEGPLGRVLALYDRGETLVELTGAFVEAPEHDGKSAVPECLVPPAMALVAQGGSEVRLALEVAGGLVRTVVDF